MSKILVLKRCIEGGKAYNGFIYPKAGEVVEAEDWEDSEECGDGLHGWTEDKWEYYDFKLKGNWVVLEVNKEDGFVELGDKVKFRKGKVLYNGESLDMAKELMLKQYPKMVFHFDNQEGGNYSTQTAGSNSTQTAGAYSTQKAGDDSTQTAWHSSTQTAGDDSTQKADSNSTQTAGDNSTQTAGNYSTQTALYSSTQTAGNYSTQTALYSSTQTAGSNSTQTAWHNSTQTAGDDSTQKAGSNSTQTAGAYSTQTAGDDSTQKAGSNSTQTAGAYSTQTAWHNSTQTAGDNSFICHYVENGYINTVTAGNNTSITSINIKTGESNTFINKVAGATYEIGSDCIAKEVKRG